MMENNNHLMKMFDTIKIKLFVHNVDNKKILALTMRENEKFTPPPPIHSKC